MASKPTDLTNKGWQKLKGLTVPKTGFGNKLDAYQAAKAKTESLQTRNLAAFEAAADALQEIIKAIPDAQKKCNKTLHKDTIEALALYKPLAEKEGSELHKAFTQYHGYVDEFKERRTVCAKEQAVIEKKMTETADKLVKAVKQFSESNRKEDAHKIATAGLQALLKVQDEADKALAKPRIPGAAKETPHVDDRPGDEVFTKLINKQQEIIAIRKNAEDNVKKLVPDA